MKDLKSNRLKILLRENAGNKFSGTDLIESENNLLGFFETLVEIARENPNLINNEAQKINTHSE